MTNNIFRTVNELLDSRDCVTSGGAVDMAGTIYSDCVDDLNALRMLEPSLLELVSICTASGLKSKALDEVRGLLGLTD